MGYKRVLTSLTKQSKRAFISVQVACIVSDETLGASGKEKSLIQFNTLSISGLRAYLGGTK